MTVDLSPNPTDLTHSTAAGAIADYDPRRPVFFVPYRQLGTQFIGREDALEQVREQLNAGHRTAIGQVTGLQGLGGPGQTQLAVEYAYRYRDQYPNGVIWLSAEWDLDAQLADLAVTARWIAPESERRYALEIARHRLRSITDCLVVFDEVQDLASIRDYLPEPPALPHILITSRAGQPDCAAVLIDRLDPDASPTTADPGGRPRAGWRGGTGRRP